MKQRVSRILLFVFSLLPILIAFIGVKSFPSTIPIHYNGNGQVDGYGDRNSEYIMAGAFSAIGLFMLLVSWCVEKFYDNEPDAEAKAKKNAYLTNWIGIVLMIWMSIIQVTELIHIYWQVNEIGQFPALKVISVTSMLFMLILGIFVKKAEKNPVLGVRLSWSMTGEDAWKASQESAGNATIVASVIMTVIAIAVSERYQAIIMTAGLLGIAAVMIIASYMAVKKLKNENKQNEPKEK